MNVPYRENVGDHVQFIRVIMEKIDENQIRQFISVTMEKIVENEFILENSYTCDFCIFVIFLHSNKNRKIRP